MHTVAGGAANAGAPAFVAIPGYSTGSSFLFKLFDGLSAGFRLYAVDLLGTGLSGAARGLAADSCGAGGAGPRILPHGCSPARAAHSLFPSHHAHHPCSAAGRPSFKARSTEEAEAFFVDSLDAWRREQGLDKMVLMGERLARV